MALLSTSVPHISSNPTNKSMQLTALEFRERRRFCHFARWRRMGATNGPGPTSCISSAGIAGMTIGLTKSIFTRRHLPTRSGPREYRRRSKGAASAVLNRNLPRAVALQLPRLLVLLSMTLGREKGRPTAPRVIHTRGRGGNAIDATR